jgi:acyl carrier protein
VAEDGASLPAAGELREALRQRLPDPMVPEAFVWLERLPLTPNGKLDRRALPKPVAGVASADEPPADPVEEWVADLWRELLGLDKVGRHDNFFDLGGHSIVATRVVSRLEQDLGVEIPLRSLFETPTIAGLANRIIAAGMTGTAEPGEP